MVLMRCPRCGATVSPISALFKRRAEFTCGACGARLRLVGYWWVVLLPALVVLIFPFDQIDVTSTMLVALFAAIVAVSLAALRLIVRVKETSDVHDA
jgi:hypothetical protein